MDIQGIRKLIEDDFKATDQLILSRLKSDVALINQVGHYIVRSGGKRLRPLIVLLSAKALNYEGKLHIDLAAIVEFIHTATLLHDDVVDGSDQRRSQHTANAVWGNAASVLVGDFLYSRAFEMMVTVDSMKVMDLFSTATNKIAEGEVLQLLNCNDPNTSEARYREVILRKTATLFEAGARLGAIVNETGEEVELALASYGRHLGMAFQIIDDALDYGPTDGDLGKNIGDDLAEGKPTLPLIRAMQVGSNKVKKLLIEVIEHGNKNEINKVRNAIESTDAIAYTMALAKKEAQLAKESLEILPNTEYRKALAEIADFSVERSF